MGKNKLKPALIWTALAFFCFISFLTVPCEAASYQEEQTIDQSLGLLKFPWHVSHVQMHSRLTQPAWVQAGGFPPYGQEVENAQKAGPASVIVAKSSSGKILIGGGVQH